MDTSYGYNQSLQPWSFVSSCAKQFYMHIKKIVSIWQVRKRICPLGQGWSQPSFGWFLSWRSCLSYSPYHGLKVLNPPTPFWTRLLPLSHHSQKSSHPAFSQAHSCLRAFSCVLSASPQPTPATTPRPVSDWFYPFKSSITSSLTTQSKTNPQSLPPLSEIILYIGRLPIRIKVPHGQKLPTRMKAPQWQKWSTLFISRPPDIQKSIWQIYILNEGMNIWTSISLRASIIQFSNWLYTIFYFSLVVSCD